MAWLLLDEVPPATAFLGGLVCIVGVFVARRKPGPPRALTGHAAREHPGHFHSCEWKFIRV